MTYSIGDVEELTGIKAHVLRYWEEVVPGFSPQKNLNGRREYTQHDLQLIYRLNKRKKIHCRRSRQTDSGRIPGCSGKSGNNSAD